MNKKSEITFIGENKLINQNWLIILSFTIPIFVIQSSEVNAARLDGTIQSDVSNIPIRWSFIDSQFRSSLTITGAGIDNSDTIELDDFQDFNGNPMTTIKGDWWEVVSINLEIDDSSSIVFLDTDDINIDYSVRHFKPPHPELGEGPGNNLKIENLAIDANIAGKVQIQNDIEPHNPHVDLLLGRLEATSGNKFDIGSWEFKGRTIHPDPSKLIPRDFNKPHQGNSQANNRSQISFNSANNQISFTNATIDTVFLEGGVINPNDPIIDGQMVIDDILILEEDPEGKGWFVDDSIFEILVNDAPVLTADLMPGFLFNQPTTITTKYGVPESTTFSSELQLMLQNITITNTIDSPYLENLQKSVESGEERFISVLSDLPTVTNNLTISNSSSSIVWEDGKKVPESTPSLVIFILSITKGFFNRKKRKF